MLYNETWLSSPDGIQKGVICLRVNTEFPIATLVDFTLECFSWPAGVYCIGMNTILSIATFGCCTPECFPTTTGGSEYSCEHRVCFGDICCSSPECFSWPTGVNIQVNTWLILPVVICLSQRLSHACLSLS